MKKSKGATRSFSWSGKGGDSNDLEYLNLAKHILIHGDKMTTRNGPTRSVIGHTMRFNLQRNKIPLLTTKKLAWKTCLNELLWFISGDTNNETLQKKGVRIWDQNASREFLDSRGLVDLEENDLGPIYGHQWRHFNAKYINTHTDYTGKGSDQLGDLVSTLKKIRQDTTTQEDSRRLIMSAWNPQQLCEMALPPCHVLSQFHVNGDDLSCSLYQRSGDVGLGVPFNIASYSFLTHLIAHHCGFNAKEFIHHIGDAHIYETHVEALKEQIERTPFESPTIEITTKMPNLEDYGLEHFEINNYKHWDVLNMDMIA